MRTSSDPEYRRKQGRVVIPLAGVLIIGLADLWKNNSIHFLGGQPRYDWLSVNNNIVAGTANLEVIRIALPEAILKARAVDITTLD